MIRTVQGGVLLQVRAVPGARTDRIVGVLGDALKVAVAAPPDKGKANDRLLAVLAKALGVARRELELVSGAAARNKTVLVRGMDAATVSERLAPHREGS